MSLGLLKKGLKIVATFNFTRDPQTAKANLSSFTRDFDDISKCTGCTWLENMLKGEFQIADVLSVRKTVPPHPSSTNTSNNDNASMMDDGHVLTIFVSYDVIDKLYDMQLIETIVSYILTGKCYFPFNDLSLVLKLYALNTQFGSEPFNKLCESLLLDSLQLTTPLKIAKLFNVEYDESEIPEYDSEIKDLQRIIFGD